MLRRRAVSLLIGALSAKASGSLDRLLDPGRGSALLLDVRTRRLIATNSEMLAARTLMPPGSTLKPFVLAALLKRGKLRPDTSVLCPTRLSIGNRRFDCTHPRLVTPIRPDTALAYSCNCFVAKVAEQFDPGELSRELASLAKRIEPATTPDMVRMQALGEAGVLITPLELALAYRQLALSATGPILAGLEGAVEYGTAQQARVAGATVAGKTGSTRSAAGGSIAWFAGFMPSRAAQVVVTVMLSGHSGGSDAAPVASQILEAYRAGRL
jgi:cell division protein FtsI/penicillin-binding protein 2